MYVQKAAPSLTHNQNEHIHLHMRDAPSEWPRNNNVFVYVVRRASGYCVVVMRMYIHVNSMLEHVIVCVLHSHHRYFISIAHTDSIALR